MITGELKSRIDRLWEAFWTGGITNPLTVIEQISYLMFCRMLDIRETTAEKKEAQLGKSVTKLFNSEEQHLRWSRLRHMESQAMLELMQSEVFPFLRRKAEQSNALGKFMKDANFMIQKATLLQEAVEMVNNLPLAKGDTKGDLYEYLLSKLTTAGINGQFRTPRHIIDLMVRLLDIQPDERVADPSAGTGGFLVGAMQVLMEKNSSEAGTTISEEGDKIYTGDLLTPQSRKFIENEMFYGFDFDATMLRIAAMNLMLHDVPNPQIYYQDTLSGTFSERFPNASEEYFDVILANPPFKGSLDYDSVSQDLLGRIKTKKTELLFLVLMLRLLKPGGRCACVVPDGVLFGSSKAHVALRKMLLEEHQLEAVISLPSGVFKPYAGVSTGIIVFTKGAGSNTGTQQVWFYDVQNDGYSLDDRRNPIDENDLPDLLDKWPDYKTQKHADRKEKAFFVPTKEIRDNNFDLSINRYKEIVYEEEEYDPPKVILDELEKLEREIVDGLKELRGMLK